MKEVFMWLSFSESSATTILSLNNELNLPRHTLISFNSNELFYYLVMTSLDRCIAICNTFDDFSNRIPVLNWTNNNILYIFNMISTKKKIKKINTAYLMWLQT